MFEETDDETRALERADRLIREGVIGDRGQIASIIVEAVWEERMAWQMRADAVQRLVHLLGARAVYVCDNLEDHGDGVVSLGSTNDAAIISEMKALYDEYRLETGDMGPDDALTQK